MNYREAVETLQERDFRSRGRPGRRRVIQDVLNYSQGFKTFYLGEHSNMMITAFDNAILLSDTLNQSDAIRFVEAGETLTLYNDSAEYITLTSAPSGVTRVRIVVW